MASRVLFLLCCVGSAKALLAPRQRLGLALRLPVRPRQDGKLAQAGDGGEGKETGWLERFQTQLAYERSFRSFPPDLDDPQLLYGDILALTSVALVHTIWNLATAPDFPGLFAPVTGTPHFTEMVLRASVLVLSWVIGAGYNNALFSGAARTKETAINVTTKASLDMTNAHLVLVVVGKVLVLRTYIDPAELGFDCFGAICAILVWRVVYAERFMGDYWS